MSKNLTLKKQNRDLISVVRSEEKVVHIYNICKYVGLESEIMYVKTTRKKGKGTTNKSYTWE